MQEHRRPYDWEREWPGLGEAPLPEPDADIIAFNDSNTDEAVLAARQQLIDAFDRAAEAIDSEIDDAALDARSEEEEDEERDALLALKFYKALVQGGYRGTRIDRLRQQTQELLDD